MYYRQAVQLVPDIESQVSSVSHHHHDDHHLSNEEHFEGDEERDVKGEEGGGKGEAGAREGEEKLTDTFQRIDTGRAIVEAGQRYKCELKS